MHFGALTGPVVFENVIEGERLNARTTALASSVA
jgi:hypothetical protein